MQNFILQEENLRKVLKESYNISPATLLRKPGWSDATFYVKSNDGVEFTFKVFLDSYTKQLAKIEAEIALIDFLFERDFPVPKVIRNITGTSYSEQGVKDENGRVMEIQRYRLQEYKKGLVLDGQISLDMNKQIGDLTGRLVAAFVEFHHPFYESKPDPHFLTKSAIDQLRPWDVLSDTTDKHQNQLIAEFSRQYEDKISSKLDKLVMQMIHGDIHGGNIIVNEGAISGLIDFSDARLTLRIIEPATALFCIIIFSDDKMRGPRQFIKSFLEHVPLNKSEMEALPVAVAGAILRCLIIDNHLRVVDPNYRPYDYLARLYGKAAWDLVEALLRPDSEENKLFASLA